MVVEATAYYTKLIMIKTGMLEPKQTVGMGYEEIFKLLKEKYRMGRTGKEYNLITKYTNSIIKTIFYEGIKFPILIKFSYIRKEWIKAAIHYTNKGKVREEKQGLIIEG